MTEGPRRVLVVDDESAIGAYLTTVLEDHGYEAMWASDADAAVNALRDGRPDLICLDIMMPKRSGVALYRDLRLDARTRDIPVVFVSAFNQLNDLRQSRLFHGDGNAVAIPEPQAYIEKPIHVAAFVETIAAILGCRAGDPAAEGKRSDGR